MKALRIFAIAASALALVSCTKSLVNGNEETVETVFTAELPADYVATRAIGDGSKVDQLVFAAYDKDGNELANLRQNDVPIVGKKATVKTQLVKGEKYSFVFWAQKKGNTVYDVTDLKAIKINYANASCNAEEFDAFISGNTTIVSISPWEQGVDKKVTLTRPFAQLNFGTLDYSKLQSQGKSVVESSIKISQVASTIKPLEERKSNWFDDPVDVEFKSATIPNEELDVNGTKYTYLAMAYVLPAKHADETSHKVSATFKYADGQTFTLNVPNTPIKRNYRTNIYGNLLTTDQNFNVSISEDWLGQNYLDKTGIIVAQIQAGEDVTLEEDLELTSAIVISQGISSTINLNGHKIINRTGATPGASAIAVHGTLTIGGDGEVRCEAGGRYDNAIQVEQGANLTINGGTYSVAGANSCIYVENVVDLKGNDVPSEVTINGGTFSCDKANDQSVYFVLNQDDTFDSDVKCFIVNGGTFFNFNPAESHAENPVRNYVTEGKTSTKTTIDGKDAWVVK